MVEHNAEPEDTPRSRPDPFADAERVPVSQLATVGGQIVAKVARGDTPVIITKHGVDRVAMVALDYNPGTRGGLHAITPHPGDKRRESRVACSSCRRTALLIGTTGEIEAALADWIAEHTDPDHLSPTPRQDPARPPAAA